MPAARSLGYYRKALRSALDPAIFEANPWRLGWYVTCLGGAVAAFLGIVLLGPAWPLKLLLGIVLGICTGTLGFICHELSHGSVVSNRWVRSVLGFLGSCPFLTSPTYWAYSHDRLHHGKAQKMLNDPDAFPTLRIYRSSRLVRYIFPFTPGSGHKRSYLYFFYWFGLHNVMSQTFLRFRGRIYDGMDHRRVTLEFLGQLAIVTALFVYAGPANWAFAFLIPFMIQNYMMMSYISTNHNLSPLTSENDPLANSLSVSNHPWLEFLNLNFGYHVEHHLFPTVNGKHAKAVHRELVRQFPDDYKIMPKGEAMRRLYQTARIYKNSRELINPETMQSYPTL